MIYDRIRSFVERLSPELVCDACVVDRLALSAEQMPASAINELTGNPEFERQVGDCALCGTATQAIRRKGR